MVHDRDVLPVIACILYDSLLVTLKIEIGSFSYRICDKKCFSKLLTA